MSPNPCLCPGRISMSKRLVRADEGIDHANGIGRMDIVVNVTVHEHEVAFQVGSDLWIRFDRIYECGIAGLHFLRDSVMLFAPPPVVDAVVVVSRAGNGSLEEVRVFEHRCCGHETAAGVSVDADPVQVNPAVSCP